MDNCYIHYYIKYTYIDKNGSVKEAEKEIYYDDIGGKCKSKNQWFYSFASKFNNSNDLAKAILERLYAIKLKRAKNPERYAKTHENEFKIHDLKSLELLIHPRYAASDFSPLSYSSNVAGYYKLPIFYADAYYNNDVKNRQPYQMIDSPENMTNPLKRLQYALALFGSDVKKQSNDETVESRVKEYNASFRLDIAKQTKSFLRNNLERIKNAIDYNPRSTHRDIDDACDIGCLLSMENNDPADFVNRVLFDKYKDGSYRLLFAGQANFEHNKYLVFLSSVVNQIHAHELAKRLDKTGLFPCSFLRTSYLHGQLCNELLYKSMDEVFTEKVTKVASQAAFELADKLDCTGLFSVSFKTREGLATLTNELSKRTSDEILRTAVLQRQLTILTLSSVESEVNEKLKKDVYSDLYFEYKASYPDLTDEEIHELIQPDCSESDNIHTYTFEELTENNDINSTDDKISILIDEYNINHGTNYNFFDIMFHPELNNYVFTNATVRDMVRDRVRNTNSQE